MSERFSERGGGEAPNAESVLRLPGASGMKTLDLQETAKRVENRWSGIHQEMSLEGTQDSLQGTNKAF